MSETKYRVAGSGPRKVDIFRPMVPKDDDYVVRLGDAIQSVLTSDFIERHGHEIYFPYKGLVLEVRHMPGSEAMVRVEPVLCKTDKKLFDVWLVVDIDALSIERVPGFSWRGHLEVAKSMDARVRRRSDETHKDAQTPRPFRVKGGLNLSVDEFDKYLNTKQGNQ